MFFDISEDTFFEIFNTGEDASSELIFSQVAKESLA